MPREKYKPSDKPSENLSGVDALHNPIYNDDGTLVKPPGPLKSEKRELYCQMRVQGNTKTDSYLAAGYKPKDRHRAGMDGHKLETNSDIIARIHEIKHHNGAHDESADARDNPAITHDFVNTQMKLLLVQAKQADQLKLAKEIIIKMGEQIGMYQENRPDDSKALTPPNPAGNTYNISELNQIVKTDIDGSRESNKPARIIDV